MGWHVHHLNGKYNIWSTVVDAYLIEEWTDEDEIIKTFIHQAIERGYHNGKRQIERAKEGHCSAYPHVKHSLEEIEELAKKG